MASKDTINAIGPLEIFNGQWTEMDGNGQITMDKQPWT